MKRCAIQYIQTALKVLFLKKIGGGGFVKSKKPEIRLKSELSHAYSDPLGSKHCLHFKHSTASLVTEGYSTKLLK